MKSINGDFNQINYEDKLKKTKNAINQREMGKDGGTEFSIKKCKII